MATKVPKEFANFEAKISLSNPVQDYTKLMDDKMKPDFIVPTDIYNECWQKISAAARETIWKMLFDEANPPNKKQLEKAAELLKMHKEDACFYQAAEYNKWIVKVRDELLKKNMVEFWKDEIVKKELGPCWARDSDLFDDTSDPEPANFYKHANCEAPWLRKEQMKAQTAIENPFLLPTETPQTNKTLRKISQENAIEDYKYNMETQGEIDGDDEEAYGKIFAEAREMVWHLLFSEPDLSSENSEKAAELLNLYKRDACFYNPWDYNDWIPEVRNNLIKKKYYNFWQDVIVEKQLGLCWAKDSDYFDDMDDPEPHNFYKMGNDLMKKEQGI